MLRSPLPRQIGTVVIYVLLALTVLSLVTTPVAAAATDGTSLQDNDRDGDGVKDSADECPDQKGAKDNGCPVTVDICGTAFLPQVVSAVIQFCIYGCGIGMFVTYVTTSTAESLPQIGDEQVSNLKSLRRRAISAGLKGFLAGPVMLVLINAAGLPWASCISLVPV